LRLSLEGVNKSYGAQLVLNDVSLAVGPRTRIGLVGPNGVGKSTLLRVLAGDEEPDAGRVGRAPAGLLVGYLAQERDARADESLLAYLARRTGVATAEQELERRTAQLAVDGSAVDAYGEALDRFLALGGVDLEARAGAVCAELGLPVELDRPLADMSGGEAGRAALAAILLAKFDVFLLDEPTNDLDLDGLGRLQRFLSNLPCGMVVVSHDRAFLDATVTRVAEIDPATHRLHEWAGGWSAYAEARDAARERAYKAFVEGQERRREVTALLARRQTEARGRGAKLGEKTGGADRRGTHALMTKVRQAERALERVDAPDKPHEPWQLRLELVAGERPGDIVATLERAVVERPEAGFTLGPVDLDVAWGERIAITGANGTGKTTLLAALLGELPLASGRRVLGRRTIVGTIDQRRAPYRGDEVLLEAFRARTGLPAVQARTLLAKFGLGAAHVVRRAGSLSPGERTRAQLAELQVKRVNLLVLDEPTNHLDLEAVEQLELALAGFAGSILVASHDRRFLESVAPQRELALPQPA
jgi:ATPase subunit of ABC transporter with duplicated ATPase domains